MINLKSKTLKAYYGEIPYEYCLKFLHYNIILEDEANEYQNLEEDIKKIKEYVKSSFMLYFSDTNNLLKVNNNTNILDLYSEDTYLRIRSNKEYKEYKEYKTINKNLNLIIELCDLYNIDLENDNIIIQINKVNELPINLLEELLKKYNIKKVLVGQIPYITKNDAYLLDILSNMYKIDKSNQLELEKNNNITNDIYDVKTYTNILHEMYNIINNFSNYRGTEKFIKMFYYLANNIYYTDDGVEETIVENQNLIGPLFNKKCVCEGYSKLLQQLCSLIGIDSIIVSGGGNKEEDGHIWNQVMINNEWYNADVTFQSWAVHNNENRNFCLVSDDKLLYKMNSIYGHVCEKDYNEYYQL